MCPILEIARQSPGIKLILLLLQPWLGCHVSVVRSGWKMAVNQIDISSNILIINKTVNKATLRHSSLSLNLHEDGYVGNQEMMSLAPQSRFGDVPFCFIHSRCEHQLCVWCDLLAAGSNLNCISLRISDEPAPLQPLRGAAGLQCGGSGPVRGLYGQHQLWWLYSQVSDPRLVSL